MQEHIMKKHDVKKRRGIATNDAPSRQTIPRERKGLTVVKCITIQVRCEGEKAPSEVLGNGVDNEWENWAAAHHSSAL